MVNPKEQSGASFTFLPVVIILLVLVLAFSMFNSVSRQQRQQVGLNQLAADLRAGRVAKMVVYPNRVVAEYYDGKQVVAYNADQAEFFTQLASLGVRPEDLRPEQVKIEIVPPSPWGDVFTVIGNLIPLFLAVGIVWMFIRQIQGGNNAALNFAKSRAKMVLRDRPTVTFDDVAGADEAKEELKEVVEFLKDPQRFRRLGARVPKGVLLVGPPGVGKTLLARAVAGEAGVPYLSGSEFVEMFVGVGASRVRDLFQQARKHAPCIVFIDEIDAVGRQRGAGLGGSHDEREQTLNQLLVEMDGFDQDTNIIVMAATNRPDILDPALLRPGRFDRRIIIDRPDLQGRLAILKIHARGKPMAPDVDLEAIAKATPGFVGADLENLTNEAALLAARRGKDKITQQELEEAIERVIAGPERKSRVIPPEEKLIIAYHEAGHAIVMQALPEADPVHKVSISPRGMAGGYTMALPEEDYFLSSRRRLFAQLVSLLGGRVAEELVFDDITTGAANDLEQVTRLARTMVTRFGMSDSLGPMTFGKNEGLIFLGRDLHELRDYSEAVAQRIDEEVQKLVRAAYEKAREILTQYRDALDRVAQALLEKETLSREEFEALFPPPVPKRPIPTPKAAAA